MTRLRRRLPPPTGPIPTLDAGSSSFKFAVFEQTASGAPRTRLRGEVTGLGAAPRMVTHDASGGSIADKRWPDGLTPDFGEVLAHGAVGDHRIRKHVARPRVLAHYPALCQAAGIVPIVVPEVLMTGARAVARCEEVTGEVLEVPFDELRAQSVVLEKLILKPNMVLPGPACAEQDSIEAVATVRCLRRNVPAAVAGIAFLSGGQPGERATARLNAMNSCPASGSHLPWLLVFSFARAIQQPALGIWGDEDANVAAAQHALLHRARCNLAALDGKYEARGARACPSARMVSG